MKGRETFLSLSLALICIRGLRKGTSGWWFGTMPSPGINERMKRNSRNRLYDQPVGVNSTWLEFVWTFRSISRQFFYLFLLHPFIFPFLVTSSNWKSVLLVAWFWVYRMRQPDSLNRPVSNEISKRWMCLWRDVWQWSRVWVRCLKVVDKKLLNLNGLAVLMPH
jgi:hypothetical protein